MGDRILRIGALVIGVPLGLALMVATVVACALIGGVIWAPAIKTFAWLLGTPMTWSAAYAYGYLASIVLTSIRPKEERPVFFLQKGLRALGKKLKTWAERLEARTQAAPDA